ncbi:hypothetical protein E2C01_040064 [Portunus trituberculatus]|uniref:Uncharacterized protein n=1 Tax=Portunus trituberculatus TaxID=210409 RepID=A0A5B7FLN4_PORTR|nr:hypothetical protein [Portunus trituberculatus]
MRETLTAKSASPQTPSRPSPSVLLHHHPACYSINLVCPERKKACHGLQALGTSKRGN